MDKKMLLFLALFLFAASIAGYIAMRTLPNNGYQGIASQSNATPTVTPTLIPYPTKGAFVLSPSVRQGTVNTPFTLQLMATSEDTVGGYDVILSYDKSAFTSQAVQNLTDSFRIFTYDKWPDHISVSGTKDLTITTPVRFANTPVIQFTFLPLRAGVYTFSLKAVGAESSKMVNEAAQVTYPSFSDLRLEIK
jgi:hypothetical protein